MMLYFGNREPPLDEVFDDPIVRLLMARDGMPPDEARAHVERVRASLREQRRRSVSLGREEKKGGVYCGAMGR
jgi:hypothetical protein